MAAVALGYFAYNSKKITRTLRVIPVMAAGVTDHLWGAADLGAAREFSGGGGKTSGGVIKTLRPADFNIARAKYN